MELGIEREGGRVAVLSQSCAIAYTVIVFLKRRNSLGEYPVPSADPSKTCKKNIAQANGHAPPQMRYCEVVGRLRRLRASQRKR